MSSNQNKPSVSMKPRIYIEVASDLRPLLPSYLEERKEDLISLKVAIENNDLEFIRKMSHAIQGHGAGFGFVQLTEICKKMELASQDKNSEVVIALLKEYEEYINRVELN